MPAIAFDLPGQGESDRFDDQPIDVGHWAQTSVKVLAALGVDAFHLYGHNTGAMVAVELANVVPTRVKSLVLDAPLCLTPDQRTQWTPKWLEGVDPVSPTWDGTHLLRIWHMRRDMGLWWPWFAKHMAPLATWLLRGPWLWPLSCTDGLQRPWVSVLSRTLKGSTMEWQTCKRKLDWQRSVTAIENALRGGLASLNKWCR
jgi:pimeloyl-ACP methyl ester carboxylesterase